MKSKRDMLKMYPTFISPGFLSGAARVLDFGANFSKYSSCYDADEYDTMSIKSDWTIVGNDIKKAITDLEL